MSLGFQTCLEVSWVIPGVKAALLAHNDYVVRVVFQSSLSFSGKQLG